MKSEWRRFLADAGAEFSGERVRHFGNPAREAKAALGGTVFADLGYQGVIAAHGDDATHFLQSQLSNDIENITPTHSQLNAFCTPKGRMLGLMRIFRRDDTCYLRLPVDTLEAVLQRLRMFVLRANVTLEDATQNFIRLGVAGDAAADQLAAALGEVPADIDGTLTRGDYTIIRVPGIEDRFEVFVSSLDAACRLWDDLNVHAAPVGEASWRLLEILAGMPAVFAGTSEQFVPQMVNLTSVNGLSFTKGCYPGQEIVARTRYLGKLKRRMYLCRIAQDEPLLPGAALYDSSGSEQAAGHVVDAQPDPDGGQVALAVLRIEAATTGTLRTGSQGGAALELLELPYPVIETDDSRKD